MPQTQQREVSPNIIRAWFDTVLKPAALRAQGRSRCLEARRSDLEISIEGSGFAGPNQVPYHGRLPG